MLSRVGAPVCWFASPPTSFSSVSIFFRNYGGMFGIYESLEPPSKFKIQNMEYAIRNSKYIFGIPNTVFGIPYTLFGIPNTVFGIPYTLFGIPNMLFGIPNMYLEFRIRIWNSK